MPIPAGPTSDFVVIQAHLSCGRLNALLMAHRLPAARTLSATGVKTTRLKTMILDDMRTGAGLCVIDPHGDLFKERLGQVPEEQIEDVVVLDPTDVEYPVGLNMLEHETEAQRHFLVQEVVGIITRMIEGEYGSGAMVQFAGPIFFRHMRMNLLLAISNPHNPDTLLEFLYQEKGY